VTSSTIRRLAFFTGLGLGYVLGTRAGRERYEQLRRLARAIRENPTVQETAGIAQAKVSGLASSAKGRVLTSLSETSAGQKLSHTQLGEQLGFVDLTEGSTRQNPGIRNPAGSATW
jgi:hypothetical protein